MYISPGIQEGMKLLRPIWHLIGLRLGRLRQHEPRPMRIPKDYIETRLPELPPQISIVTPTYMQGDYIERTIQSVLSQHYPNIEYRVQDGGSDDGTREILSRYAEKLSGWESRDDSGQSQAINMGFSKTSGEIMAWLNSDDILLPGALAYVANYFADHPEVDVIYGHRILIDENDKQIGRWVMPPHNDAILSWADYIPQETMFWRRSIWEKVGGKLDESFCFAMDWDLLVRFREAGAHFVRLPRFLAGFRVHPNQKSTAVISEVGVQEMHRIRMRTVGERATYLKMVAAVAPYLLMHVVSDWLWQIRSKGELG